jgi:hypothetical protein
MIGTGALGVLAYLSVFLTTFLLAHRLARSRDSELAPAAIAAAAAMVSLVVGSALLDTLALPQLAYLICFIAGMVVAAQDAPGLADRRLPAAAQAPPLRPRLVGELGSHA